MSKREVVVEGGGRNLYEIRESSGNFTALQVAVGLMNSYTSIGSAKSLEDAITLIRVHSGRQIEKLGPPR